MNESKISDARAQMLLERVVALYCRNLQEQSEPRHWLAERGLTDLRIWEIHRLGYCDGALRKVLPADEAIIAELTALGVFDAVGTEFFNGSITCPITTEQGLIATVTGLPLDGIAVMRRLPRRPAKLWNSAVLNSATDLYLTTSIIDGLSLTASGVTNVVADLSGGLVNLPEQLQTSGVRHVTLVVGDTAAARNNARRLGLEGPSLLALPGVQSANDFLVRKGAQELAAAIAARTFPPRGLDGAEPLPDGFILHLKKRRYEVRGLEPGPRLLKATVRLECAGRMHIDTLDLYCARARRRMVRESVRICNESADTVEADLERVLAAAEGRTAQLQAQASNGPISSVILTEAERTEAESLARSPNLVPQILDDFERCGLVGERTNKLLCYLAVTSRKLADPLAVLILASSGAGKSALQEAAIAFCPPEDLVKLTSLSGKALFYKERTSLKHKVLAVEEGEGLGAASYALRNLISAGELVVEATMRDPTSGRLITMANKVEGPTAVFVTTTNPEMDSEIKSRFIVTSIDESREQTQAVLAWQRQQQGLPGLSQDADRQSVVHRHWALQRLLEPVAVVNPFAEQLSFGDDRLTSRRDQPKYFRLMAAVALLRQRQKPVKQIGQPPRAYVEVDREDVRLANQIATELFGHTLGELSRPGYELLLLLTKMRGERPSGFGDAFCFCRREVREHGRWSHARVHRYLCELLELEYVTLEGRGGRHIYRLRWDGAGQDGERFLLGLRRPEELSG